MPNRPLNYDEIVLMVGQGNFLATLSRAILDDGNGAQEYAQVDLFRIENGKVVEHWDNAEPVQENYVNSGKILTPIRFSEEYNQQSSFGSH